ncbi:MAG: hypothetical protein ACOC2F_07965 [Bacteroidota bacterium]
MEPNKLNSNKMSNYLEHEKEKVKHLMRNFSKPLKEIKAIPSASEMSALYAIGYEVIDEDVICTIYIYENQQQHETALKLLRNNLAAQKENSITSSNGGLFFWGYQKTDDSRSKYILNDLVSAFSGEE